ncbi:hypothetical protein [Sporosarcina globispora]|nr:hypothetical protein [Sporosarcina globispora]
MERGLVLTDVWSHLAAIIVWTAAVFALAVRRLQKTNDGLMARLAVFRRPSFFADKPLV